MTGLIVAHLFRCTPGNKERRNPEILEGKGLFCV